MDIIFRDSKFEKECSDHRLLQRRQGPVRSKRIMMRLQEIKATNALEVLRNYPQARCHELKGERKGQLSVDLDGPFRLIFEPANEPLPRKPDGGLDWSKVTSIRIIEVTDYHE